jgi:hypothetical protein
MDMRRLGHPSRGWIVTAWVIGIASGALVTSVIRIPAALPGSAVLMIHFAIGLVLAIATLALLVRRRQSSEWLLAVLVVGTLASGWLTRRAFAPGDAAVHAAIGAFACLGMAFSRSTAQGTANAPDVAGRRRWQTRVVRVGFVLALLQIALGALLRHHLIGLAPHLLVGGLAAVAILVPSVALTYDSSAIPVERQASRMAITALLLQVAVGIVLLLMMLSPLLMTLGESSAAVAWIVSTVAHVVTGTLTVLAVGRLASVLRAGGS